MMHKVYYTKDWSIIVGYGMYQLWCRRVLLLVLGVSFSLFASSTPIQD
jgi:hypothetical protein